MYNETVDLECEVECGNPENYTYIWSQESLENDSMILRNTTTNTNKDTLLYSLNDTSINETIIVTCTVKNGIKTNALQESQTVFVINKTSTTSKYFLHDGLLNSFIY
jgi:hypothetical protein